MRSWMIGAVSAFVVVGYSPVLLPGWLLLLMVGIAAVLLHAKGSASLLVSGMCAAAVVGSLYGYSLLQHRVKSNCEAVALTIEGQVSSLPQRTSTRFGEDRQRFEFTVERIEPLHCQGPRQLLLSFYGKQIFEPNQRWRLAAKLKKPWGLANPGLFTMQSWYVQNSIDGTGIVVKDSLDLLSDGGASWSNPVTLRQRIGSRIDNLPLEKDTKSILRALTVADKSGLRGTLGLVLKYFGINHLLVISGLHIGIVAGAGYLSGAVVGRLAYLGGFFRLAALIPGLLAFMFALSYSALAGFAVPTVRALCMLGCFIAASLVSRKSLSASNLLIAAFFVLLINPLSATGSGFWLSFCAVGCLLWLGLWRVNIRFPLQLLHTHLYMALAMIPMGGWLFGGVSQVAAVVNLLMVPLIGLYVVPMALLAVTAFVLAMPVDQYLWQLAAWPIQRILPKAMEIAANHSELLYLHLSPSAVDIVMAITGLALVITPLPNTLKILIPILMLPVFLADTSIAKKRSFIAKIAVLDVGQGTAVVVVSGNKALVYDTGAGDPNGPNLAGIVVLPYLRANGINRLDTFLVSHWDNDHSAGTASILRSMPVGNMLVGTDVRGYDGARACRVGEAWRWPSGLSFQVISAQLGSLSSNNNSSCVLQIQIAGVRLLLAGDIGAKREREILRYWRNGLYSELLLVAHHGSATSSSYPWIKTVQPREVIVSAGYLNHFGHPSRQVSRRYQEAGSNMWITSRDGAVEIYITPGGSIALQAHRASLLPYWM